NGEVRRYASDDRWEANLEGTSSWTRPQIIGDLTDTRMGNPGALPQPAFYLRKTIQLSGTVRRARLYVTALGSYKFFVNARGVGDGVLTPEFTDYRKRVIYQSYDVTNLLAEGKNVLAAMVGDGWHGSGLTWLGVHFFTPPNRLLAQLQVDYSDNRHEIFS